MNLIIKYNTHTHKYNKINELNAPNNNNNFMLNLTLFFVIHSAQSLKHFIAISFNANSKHCALHATQIVALQFYQYSSLQSYSKFH